MSQSQSPQRRSRLARWWSSQSKEAKAAYIVGLATVIAAVIGAPIITHELSSGGTNSKPPSASLTSPRVSTSLAASGAATSPAASNLTTSPPVASAPTPSFNSQYLSDLNSVSDSGSLYTGSAEVNGRPYPKSVILYLNPGPASVAYNLGRQWRSLITTVGMRDDSTQGEKFQFQAFGDGRLIYNHVFALGDSQHITIDVIGVLRLELDATLVSNYIGPAYAIWGDADLTG